MEVFKHLGWLLTYDDNDMRAVMSNLQKVQEMGAQVSCVLRLENASPRFCGNIFVTTVQVVLLFGLETWSLTHTTMKRLDEFHI